MKKIILLSLAVTLLILALTACDGSSSPIATVAPTMPNVAAPPVPEANVPPLLQYDHGPAGKWLFVNGPEPIDWFDTAEEGIALYIGEFDTGLHLWFGHNNYSGTYLYYGVYFYNTSTEPITLEMHRRGGSFGWTTNSETIQLYYEWDGNIDRYTIAPGAHQWIHFTRDSSLARDGYGARTFSSRWDPIANRIPSANGTWDGIVRFYTDAPLNFRVMSWITDDLNSFDPMQTEMIPSAPTLGTTTYANHIGEVSAAVHWTIDDTTQPGRLPVSVNGNIFDFWRTNAVGDGRYIVNHDSLPLFVLDRRNEWREFHYSRPDPRTGGTWEWANIGALYHHHFFFTNHSSRPVTFAYYIERPTGRNAYMGAWSPLNSPAFRPLPFSDINNWLDTHQLVVEITVQPGETGFMPAEFTMGGQSFHHVGHFVVMRPPICFGIEPQQSFSVVSGQDVTHSREIIARNTSGISIDDFRIVVPSKLVTLEPADSFVTALAHGDSETITISPSADLPVGVYNVYVSFYDGSTLLNTFPVHIVVHERGTYSFLNLIPDDAWWIHTGNSVIDIERDGDSLLFSNTEGRWPSATGHIDWGSGVRFERHEWAYTYIEFDVTVTQNASFVIMSQGPSLPQHRIPLAWAMNEWNTTGQGGMSGDDLGAGRYVGRINLEELMWHRERMPSEYYFNMPGMDVVYMDGWRVFAIGSRPATVRVDVLRIVRI